MSENETIVVTIDGRAVQAARGELLVTVINRLDKSLPQICYHESLGPLKTCDTCLVEVDGELQRACETKVERATVVSRDSSRAKAAREESLHRILGNHNLYCTLCDYNNDDCEVHNATRDSGILHQKYPFSPKPYPIDKSNPFYQYDPGQCILCGRCVEACQNVQVTETLSIDWEAEYPRVVWDDGREINESSCVSCGHCVTVCPCNALMEKSMIGEAGHFTSAPIQLRRSAIDLVKNVEKYTGFGPLFLTSELEAALRRQDVQKTKTVCTYCGVGCSFDVWTKGRKILKVQPNPAAPANGISTCIKGKFGWDFVNSTDRLAAPLVRKSGGFRPVPWDEALSTVATRLQAIVDAHGPESVAFIASSKITNEECYLVQKIARAIFGTNNVDNCARYCQSPATKGLSRTVGYGGDSGTMADMERADLVLLVASHTATSHPVLASHLKRQKKLRGQKWIVADLMEHEMAERADLFLRPQPGTDMVWMNAVARLLIEEERYDREFVNQHVHGFEDLKLSLTPFSLEYAEKVTGISRRQLEKAAYMIAEAESVCGLWAMGLTQHKNAADSCTALSNLLLLTGNYGRPGTGGYPLRGHNNVQGSCDFGALYNYLPGYTKVSDDEGRARFEKEWGVKLPSEPGLDNTTMIDRIEEGTLKALFVVGEELALVDSNIERVQKALRKLEFLVVQDIFLSTTAEFADVVLAASPSLEKEGTFVNTERRIQRLYQALPPNGQSRPDWSILTDLASHLGHEWNYASPAEIMAEIARCTPLFAGVTYERLEGYRSLCWPVHPDGTDTPLLYTDGFPFPDGKAKFHPVDFSPPAEQRDEQYDLHLNNGRVLEHFHEGNLTYRVPGMKEKVSDAFVAVAPELADERGLSEGDWVRLRSRDGELKTRVVISGRLRKMELYMPVCSSDERVNLLTSSEHDPVVHTPCYKEVAVSLERLGERGPSPLPRTNPRHGHPIPHEGVEVERKWDRADYRFPDQVRPEGGHV